MIIDFQNAKHSAEREGIYKPLSEVADDDLSFSLYLCEKSLKEGTASNPEFFKREIKLLKAEIASRKESAA